MAQRHNYEYVVNPDGDTAPARVVRMVGKGKRVLEIGAGPGSITRVLKAHNNCTITALEIDQTAIDKLSPFCSTVYRCDLNGSDWPAIVSEKGLFEVVVAADVLEHLADPLATLRAISLVLEKDGYVVVSLPHVGHNAVIACLLQEDFEYQDWGLLDRTHIRFFGIENIQRLFDDTGFKIVEAEFVVLPPEQTEFADRWLRTSMDLRRTLSQNRFGTVYQVVIKARYDSSPERGLTLSSLPVADSAPVPRTRVSVRTRIIAILRAYVVPHLSLRTRTRIGNLLYRIGLRF
jgi:2-polyprenyl-3-methyl-5-hydroxy-6-metoxy-1,4-benzoquinol methylase